MEKYLISIIVAIYNIENYLNRCINSLISQSYKNIEILLVNDGSNDASLKICESFKDPRIRIINKENGGLSSARNEGIKNANGDFCTFVDGDDYAEKDMVKNLVKDCSTYDVVFSGFTLRKNNSLEKLPINYINSEYDYRYLRKHMIAINAKENPSGMFKMSVRGNLYNLSFLRENNLFFKSERVYVSEDLIFHSDLLKGNPRVKYVCDYSYNYIINDYFSLTKTYRDNRIDCECNLCKYLLQFCSDDDEKYRVYSTFLGRVDNVLKNYYFSKKKNFRDSFNNTMKNELINEALMFYKDKKKSLKLQFRLWYFNTKNLFVFKFVWRLRK